jgi:hypothetical protein
MTASLTRKEIVIKAHEQLMFLVNNNNPHKLEAIKHLHYSHAYFLDERHFVFIKLRIAYTGSPGCDYYDDLNPQFKCVYILWQSDQNGILNTAFIVDAKVVPKYCTNITAKSKFSTQTADTLCNYLYTYVSHDSVQYLINDISILSQSHVRMTNLIEYDKIKNLEYETFNTLNKFLQDHSLWSTWEGCKADCAFALNTFDNLFLGIQIKTSNYHEPYKNWHFSGCLNYDDMLVILHPLTKESTTCFFVIPGQAIPRQAISNGDFCICDLYNCRFAPYLINDDQICWFLKALYIAVLNGDKSFNWPSGATCSIDQIKLYSKEFLDIPISESTQVEHMNHIRRVARFPELSYARPLPHLTYDIIINGIKVQDKQARKIKGRGKSKYVHAAYELKIQKSIGHINGTVRRGPYVDGDFEALWISLPDQTDFFFIPASELMERGFLAVDEKQKGNAYLSCYLPEYKPKRTGRVTNLWTTKYYILDDDQALAKIKDILFKSRVVVYDLDSE